MNVRNNLDTNAIQSNLFSLFFSLFSGFFILQPNITTSTLTLTTPCLLIYFNQTSYFVYVYYFVHTISTYLTSNPTPPLNSLYIIQYETQQITGRCAVYSKSIPKTLSVCQKKDSIEVQCVQSTCEIPEKLIIKPYGSFRSN